MKTLIAIIVATVILAPQLRADRQCSYADWPYRVPAPPTWTPFDCVRLDLAGDTMDILDHDVLGDQRTAWYEITNPAWACVIRTYYAASQHDAALVDRYLDDYARLVRRSDAHWWQKRRLLRRSDRLRVLAVAAAAGKR
jgi:hypothetical protein